MIETVQERETEQNETEIPEEKESERIVSQAEYVPTPYVRTTWELIGKPCEERDFVGMKLEVLKDERVRTDPMFECFDTDENVITEDTFDIGGGGKTKKPDGEATEEVPQFDAKAFEEELKQKYEEGRLAGLEEGVAASEAKIVENYEALAGRMKEISEQIQAQVEERIGMVEKRALKFALEISRKIVESAAQANPEYILDIIRKGMGNLGAANPIRVKVSSQDYEFLDVVGLPADLTPNELGLEYVPDESVKSGCVIETDFGEVNLELDAMWEQIKKNVFPVCE